MDVTKAAEAALKESAVVRQRRNQALSRTAPAGTVMRTRSIMQALAFMWWPSSVAVVLFLFLRHFQWRLFPHWPFPLSLLTAHHPADKFGVTMKNITIGGLAIALGAVVDDAIIDVEKYFPAAARKPGECRSPSPSVRW